MVKNLPANAGDVRNMSLISGSERYPGEGNGNLLQFVDRGAWRALVHGVTKSHVHGVTKNHTRLKQLNTQTLLLTKTAGCAREL